MKTLCSGRDLARICDRIALLGPTDQRLWGSMSAQQMVCPLTMAFRGALDDFPLKPFRAIPLPRPVFKLVALYLPLKWPHGVSAPPEVRQQPGSTPTAGFEVDRGLLLAKLDSFVRAEAFALAHPLWGPLTHTEWMRWGYLHCDHHLRQFGR